MRSSSFALASALLGVALAAPQGVTDKVTPTGSAPAECTGSFDGSFEITVTHAKEKRDVNIEKRAECGKDGILVVNLADGNILDQQDRTGYIASNFQFQFDGPPQAGALFTSGFSLCENNILALGDSTTFYQCLSGDFYNLYDRDWAEQCEPVSIVAIPCGGAAPQAAIADIGDGQIVATSVVETTIITALSDGQPQVITTSVDIPLCQIGDGQVQIHTTPCTAITSVPTPSYIPISQSSDGQIINPPPPTVLPPAPTTPAAPPPETTTEVPSETPEVPPPTEQPSLPVSSSPSPSKPPTSVSEVPSSPSETAPPVETSAPPAPPASGSSRVAAGSVGALVMGFMIAFVCL